MCGLCTSRLIANQRINRFHMAAKLNFSSCFSLSFFLCTFCLNKFTEHQFCSIKCDSNHNSRVPYGTLYMLLWLFLCSASTSYIHTHTKSTLDGGIQFSARWPIFSWGRAREEKWKIKSICLAHVVLCLSKINNRFCASYKLFFFFAFYCRDDGLLLFWTSPFNSQTHRAKARTTIARAFSTIHNTWSVISIA